MFTKNYVVLHIGMTLHEKAALGDLKGEVLTSKLLNEINEYGKTVWHEAAETINGLNHIPVELFTSDALSQKSNTGMTVLHSAAYGGTLKDIPEQFLTTDALNQVDDLYDTVWHRAAWYRTLNAIPKHLFTKNVLNQKSFHGETVWHVAARHNTLKDIPFHLFTHDALSQRNDGKFSVFDLININDQIRHLPIHLLNKDLLAIYNDSSVFLNETDTNFIKAKINCFDTFMKANPNLEKDIELRDPRLILTEINRNMLSFGFVGIEDECVLYKDSVAIKNETFNTLNDAVLFIEKNYAGIEQSLILPVNKVELHSFVL